MPDNERGVVKSIVHKIQNSKFRKSSIFSNSRAREFFSFESLGPSVFAIACCAIMDFSQILTNTTAPGSQALVIILHFPTLIHSHQMPGSVQRLNNIWRQSRLRIMYFLPPLLCLYHAYTSITSNTTHVPILRNNLVTLRCCCCSLYVHHSPSCAVLHLYVVSHEANYSSCIMYYHNVCPMSSMCISPCI